MSIKITDGMGESAHITSNDIVGKQQAIFGNQSCVFSVGQQFAATLVDNNTITIADGEGSIKGCFWRILPGSVETVTITSGTQSMYRYDVIVARYTRDNEGIESVALDVLQGTPASSLASAVIPTVTEADIRDGVQLCEYGLYTVLLNGLTVENVTPIMSVQKSLEDLIEDMNGYRIRVVNAIPSVTEANTFYCIPEDNK